MMRPHSHAQARLFGCFICVLLFMASKLFPRQPGEFNIQFEIEGLRYRLETVSP